MPTHDEEAWCALDNLVVALRESLTLTEQTLERAEKARGMRDRTWTELARNAPRPRLVELLSENLERQAEAGGRFRRAVARALHTEGMSMEAIAELFGVTRQRVSTLLRTRQGS